MPGNEGGGTLCLGSWMEAGVLSYCASHVLGACTLPGLTVGAAFGARVVAAWVGACTFEARSLLRVPRGHGASLAGLQFPAMALPLRASRTPLGS